MAAGKEFLMTDDDFAAISKMVYESVGIVLGAHKREMVYSRLSRRLRALGFETYDQYLLYLDEHHDDEFSNFINSITTNLTSFFREHHHFAFLADTIVPELKRKHARDKRIRIWSAGCSTGEEPYSIAMTLAEHFGSGWDLKILATDLDSNVLAKASAGVYSKDTVTGLSAELMKQWFVRDEAGQQFRIKDSLKQLIYFKRLNLLQDWPMKGPFDVIFCRNVVIYFDMPTKTRLFEQYAKMLEPNSYLFLGHSESMQKEQKYFTPLGKTIYQRNTF